MAHASLYSLDVLIGSIFACVWLFLFDPTAVVLLRGGCWGDPDGYGTLELWDDA